MAQKYGYFEEQPDGSIYTGKGLSTDGSDWQWDHLIPIQGRGYQHFHRVSLDSMPPNLEFDGAALHKALTE